MESNSVQEALKKVDQAMARLQEIQCTITGDSKVCKGVSLSPRSTRSYVRTSFRCKEESLKMKDMIALSSISPKNEQPLQRIASLRRSSSVGESWRRWSLPASVIQQTVGEIVEATNLAKEVAYIASSVDRDDVKVPLKPSCRATSALEMQRGDWGTNAQESQRDETNLEGVASSLKDLALGKCRKDECPTKTEQPLTAHGRTVQIVKKTAMINSLLRSEPVFARVDHDQDKNAKPASKSQLIRSNSCRVITFKDSACVSDQLKDKQTLKSDKYNNKTQETCISTKRRSLASYVALESESSSSSFEETRTLKRSSSFIRAFHPAATKLIKHSHMSSFLNKTIRKIRGKKMSSRSFVSGGSVTHKQKKY